MIKKILVLIVLTIVGCQPAFGVVSSTATVERFAANGSSTTFNFTFRLTNQTEMAAVVRADSTGVDTALTLNIDYTLSATNNDFSNGGTLTTTATYASGNTLILHREALRTQTVNLIQGQAMPAEATETTFDKQTMAIQDIDKDLGFTLTVPKGDPTTALNLEYPSSVDRASLVAAFDSVGGATAIAAVPEGSVAFSTFGTNWAESANASAARLLLDVFKYDVRDYGAVGDGVTDDRSAIQDAIDDANSAAGGKVFFPKPTTSYFIAASLVPRSNVTLEGEEGSIILFTGINAIDSSEAITNFTVRNLIFDGQSGNSEAIIIDDATSTFIKIIDCEIKNCGTTGISGRPIDIKAANYVWILNNNVHDCRTGILTANCNNVIITGNFVKDIGPGTTEGEQGILVWATSEEVLIGDSSMEKVIVSNNIIEDISDNGIRITARKYASATDTGSIDGVTVSGNVVKDAAQAAFKIHADNVTITNNIAIDAGRQAFVCSGGVNYILANNIAKQVTTRTSNIGAAITWSIGDPVNIVKNVQITGNIIDGDEWEGGIWCYGDGVTVPQGILISDNTITDVGTATPGTAIRGITVNFWNDIMISDNYLDNTYEGIGSQNSTDLIIQNNKVVNCTGGSGRGIRTATVTRAVVSGNYLHGNTDDYDLDTADTRLIADFAIGEFLVYEGEVLTYEGEILTYIE